MPHTLPSPPATAVSYPPSPSLTLKGGVASPSSSSSSTASASPSQGTLHLPVRQRSKPKFSIPVFDSDSPDTPSQTDQEQASAHSSTSALLSTPLPPPLRPEFAAVTVQASIPFPSSVAHSLDEAEKSSVGQVQSRSDVALLAEKLSSTEPVLSPRHLLKPGVSIHRGVNLRIDLGNIANGAFPQSDKPLPYNAPDVIPIPPIPSAPKHSRAQANQRASYVRKKSGELVKPSLKPQSASMFLSPSPATSGPGSSRRRANLRVSLDGLPFSGGSRSEPTTPSSPKVVHFDANLEQVKHFLAEQKPLAVSRDGSPTETSEGGEDFFNYGNRSSEDEKVRQVLEIQMVNAPPKSALEHLAEARDRDHVRLERLFLSDDGRCVRGLVIVRNLAFAKWVAARFTMDRWQTTSEVTARHVGSVQDGTYDRFEFSIRLIDFLGKIWDKTLHIAIRYSCEGHAEMWDSNGGQNYIVIFRRKSLKKTPVAQDTDDDDDDESHIQVKMTALRKSLENVMRSPSPRPVQHARANSVQNLVTSPMHTPPFVNSRSAADVLLRVGRQNSPINSGASSPTKRSFFQGDANVISPRKNREGTLAGRYDLESSLKNASSSPTTPYFPQRGMTPFPMTMTYASRTPNVSEKFQKIISTPISPPVPSTVRGSPRDAPGTPGRDGSPHSPPFRTSSDSDIPASFHSAIAGSSAPYESSSLSSTMDALYRRNNQRSVFATGGPMLVSRNGSPQRAVQSPTSLPFLADNATTKSRSSPPDPTGMLQASQFNSFPTSMSSTNSITNLSTAFPWGTSLTSLASPSVAPPPGSGLEDASAPPTALPASHLGSTIMEDNTNFDSSSSSTPSITSESSEQSSSVSSPEARAELPLGEMLEDLNIDPDVRAGISTGASAGRESRDGAEMGTLRTFLDQFCFFTGLDVGLASRRSHSASDVSDFFIQRRQQSEPSVISDAASGRSTPIALTTQQISQMDEV